MRSRSSHRSGHLTLLKSVLPNPLPSLLAVALLFQLGQLGRSYLYCQALQAPVAHSCCAAQSGTHTQQCAELAPVDDCCQVRKAPVLAPYIAAAPSAELAAPLVAVAFTPPVPDHDAFGLVRRRVHEAQRAGPPPTRARAQFMVFLV